MRYLKGTIEFGLLYGGLKQEGHKLVGYVDSDFVGDYKEVSDKFFIHFGRLYNELESHFTECGCLVHNRS